MNILVVLLLVVLVLAIVGVNPTWHHAAGWGYAPSGILGFLLVLVVILVLIGRI